MTNRAKAVAALASEWAEAGDREGQLAAPVVEALHREGLLGMWVPRTVHGGAELGPLPSLRILEEVSYGDASAGWVLMAAALATGTGGAYLGDEAVARLFGHDRLPVIAGQGTRPGTATPVAGGFRLTGSWSFASGIKHASHIHTLGVVPGTGEARIFVLPVSQATLIDNWDVLGLRATGSHEIELAGAHVPPELSASVFTDPPVQTGPLYAFPLFGREWPIKFDEGATSKATIAEPAIA